MNAWMMWLVLAGLVVILELFTGTFYLLMISIGIVAGALVAFFNFGVSTQLIIAALVGAVATVTLHKSKYGFTKNVDAARDPNVNMDIGQRIQVDEWKDAGNGKFNARTMYRGAMWDVELQHSAGYPGVYVIDEIQGSRLIVKPS
ncbi:NfeD family protein [Undibacterium sp. RTI2.1]|uniref:NfeD family protein n=1 Tax=unclassified Undibacterium TaxID=2630295 RepID=UPI002AB352B7|nr:MULTISPECIES: NfeD family protein [unclassified Undibacterium]MDY7538278.1 NfeD family protein [Undibacterium sp. 5I1]MEB0030925.1 NfeD family protein [Undibacterium sp. RTI2.1]MEB0117397.1 NfeD family protein [Undibacterium sp. RTI2.2]MEB0229449.1 NfeD family protein [Undibacterium sp. 10I3]MEB0256059.1 NfeD family protein [Undibacterium sp. 5I1]